MQGAESSCVCVCTKRVCVRNIEPKACSVGITVHIFSSVFLTHTLLVQTHTHDVSAPWKYLIYIVNSCLNFKSQFEDRPTKIFKGQRIFLIIKGTVSVISHNPLIKDVHVWFTTVPFMRLFYVKNIVCFLDSR